ncbi:hypothetical protein HUT17_04720 (plasmid) [Nocardiopsis flavescens]|uniref:Uncharacterized protein n=1 Tax=Nocardiopsis flavescens TaxID=758803 RepID=A0A6M5K8P1_9ACTN|nr:hypothetical protein [Nocardiopsis flavescens]QKW32439.1 hypothetical protein HUT17_04720 [Nocardiopsis flavescens]
MAETLHPGSDQETIDRIEGLLRAGDYTAAQNLARGRADDGVGRLAELRVSLDAAGTLEDFVAREITRAHRIYRNTTDSHSRHQTRADALAHLGWLVSVLPDDHPGRAWAQRETAVARATEYSQILDPLRELADHSPTPPTTAELRQRALAGLRALATSQDAPPVDVIHALFDRARQLDPEGDPEREELRTELTTAPHGGQAPTTSSDPSTPLTDTDQKPPVPDAFAQEQPAPDPETADGSVALDVQAPPGTRPEETAAPAEEVLDTASDTPETTGGGVDAQQAPTKNPANDPPEPAFESTDAAPPEPGSDQPANDHITPTTGGALASDDKAQRKADLIVGQADAAASAPATGGPAPRGRVEPLAHHETASVPVTIDGHAIRAGHGPWRAAWEQKGRAEAIRETESYVYSTMREQFQTALEQGRNVRLVLPSNNPEHVQQFIRMASEAGFEITLSARVPPNHLRRMQGIQQLAHHFCEQTLERAALPDELRTEHENLNKILTDAYENQSVHRIDLYSHDGDTPESTHRRLGDPNPGGTPGETTWSKDSHIRDEIDSLEKATVPGQREWINDETLRIHQELSRVGDRDDTYRRARAAINSTIDHLRGELGLEQLNGTRRTEIHTNGDTAHDQQPELFDTHEEPAPGSEHTEQTARRRRAVKSHGNGGLGHTGPPPEHTPAPAPTHSRVHGVTH